MHHTLEGYRSGHNEAVLKDCRFHHYDLPKTLVFIRVSALSACTLQDGFLAVFLQFYNLITLEGYRSGHNEAVLKPSRIHLRVFPKTLDFIEVFGCSSALCEKPFSQFSRNLLAGFSHF